MFIFKDTFVYYSVVICVILQEKLKSPGEQMDQ